MRHRSKLSRFAKRLRTGLGLVRVYICPTCGAHESPLHCAFGCGN